MFFTFLPGTQLKGELEPWSWCPSKSRWSAAPLSVRDEHWTFEHFVRERWTLLSLLAFKRLAMTLPSQADLEVVRFPNPLAFGGDLHGSWGTWLTWRLLWSRSQNHLGHAVKNPLPHFSDGEYFLLNLSNIWIWSDDQQLIFCCHYISIGQNFWGIIESNRHQNQITQCARFESIGFACSSLLMNTSDARIGKVIRI